eukprot:3496275-Rhodomonas_salina.1
MFAHLTDSGPPVIDAPLALMSHFAEREKKEEKKEGRKGKEKQIGESQKGRKKEEEKEGGSCQHGTSRSKRAGVCGTSTRQYRRLRRACVGGYRTCTTCPRSVRARPW